VVAQIYKASSRSPIYIVIEDSC